MNEYWSNEDDKKVSYVSEPPPRTPRSSPARGPAPQREDGDVFSYSPNLDPRQADLQSGDPYRPQYGGDRSAFISQEESTGNQRGSRYEYPVQSQTSPPHHSGYQLHSEHPDDDGGHGNGWLKFWIILLILILITGGAYVFRFDILKGIGNVFGDEVVARFMPTPTPTDIPPEVPAYVPSATLAMKSQAVSEIDDVTGDLDMNSYAVTDQNIIMSDENQDGTYDYYLFDYDTGRLLGYYEGLASMIPCGKNLFYVEETPYLVTSRGFPLADLESLERSAGSAVTLGPMVGGWAPVINEDATKLNYIGENGELITSLWYAKAFPFTAENTLAYVDTGNITGTDNRYALYLLSRDGTVKRLHYMADTDGYLDTVCGMAFTPDGDMHTLTAELPFVMKTDQVTAYINCGALAVRDPETGLYGLFVDGEQQYPFEFDSIEPVPSDIAWTAQDNGYISKQTVDSTAYPLPRSYSFILRKGDVNQIVTIAAVSAFPIILK